MKLFLEIAWRNLWRNYQRSLIMICGIAVGLFGLQIYYGISNGFIEEIVETAIQVELGQIQVFRKGYLQNPDPANAFQADSALVARLNSIPGVEVAAPRFKAVVLVSSAEKSGRLDLVGIDPLLERSATIIPASVDSGAYLEPGDTRRIVLGARLAATLGVGLEDKVVVMAQDRDNELQSYPFRVAGLFHSTSPSFDKSAAFVTLEAVRSLVGRPDELTSILVRTNQVARIDTVAALLARSLKDSHPELEVSPWWEISPLLSETINMFDSFVWIFYLIIYLAMAFGVINIMLMAVLDRTHELGIMRAVGTSPGQIMLLVLLEAALLGLLGLALGGASAWAVNRYLEIHGLDLSYWSSAMDFMGISSVIHSRITPFQWTVSFISTECAVVLASLWPARRASKLRPVEAIQFQ